MSVFTFVIILVLITALGKVATEIGAPLAGSLGELLSERAAEHKARRKNLESGTRLDAEVVEELEKRLGRIEDRLDFIEALKAPNRPGALTSGLADPPPAQGPAPSESSLGRETE